MHYNIFSTSDLPKKYLSEHIYRCLMNNLPSDYTNKKVRVQCS
uniref:Uncharacterized protein n=1 Tax=Arundo donax TaxID=35708 RepID=A0A0A8Y3U5_ARUDO